MNRLQGKIAVASGAGSSFGKAISLRFAREGAHVIAIEVDDRGQQTATEAKDSMEFVRGDVTD